MSEPVLTAMLLVLLFMVAFVGWTFGRWRRDDIGDGHRLDAQNAKLERDRAIHELAMDRINRRCERALAAGPIEVGEAVRVNEDGTVDVKPSGFTEFYKTDLRLK